MDEPRLDKTQVSVGRLDDPTDEIAYWHSRTPQRIWQLYWLIVYLTTSGR